MEGDFDSIQFNIRQHEYLVNIGYGETPTANMCKMEGDFGICNKEDTPIFYINTQ